jgi:hypothetical protein
MTWLASCRMEVSLHETVSREDVESAVLPLTSHFKTRICVQHAGTNLSINFMGNVPEDFDSAVLDPVARALEPLASSPVPFLVYNEWAPSGRLLRWNKVIGRTTLLPQLEPVHALIDAALQAATQLDARPERAQLLAAVAHFSQLRTTQAWSLTDVTEAARNQHPAIELGSEQARALLFQMDELTETSDIESAVFSRCVHEGLVRDDPTMPDADEWEEICEEMGLDSSFVYSDEQIREHTRVFRSSLEVPR